MSIMVTGCAGFIGMHTTLQLLKCGESVVGLDNLNNYYDVTLKKARLAQLLPYDKFRFHKMDIADRQSISELFAQERPQKVIHLAAQAGVRYSIINPYVYIDSNLQGFINVLEGCRHYHVEHLVYASSSSVYGSNASLPFNESQNIDHPISLYAATKKANELMAHTYSYLYGLPTTGLRFFTVYGPWGRPDMALFKFTQAMLSGKAIELYNNGQMTRDFTYINDIVEGIVRVINKAATSNLNFNALHPDPATSSAAYRIFNIGNNSPTPLMDYINALEETLEVIAIKNYLPMQPGDLPATAANTDALHQWVEFKPNTPVPVGIKYFVEWYRKFYKV